MPAKENLAAQKINWVMSNLGPRIFQDLDRKHPIASAHDFVKSIFEQIGKCRGL